MKIVNMRTEIKKEQKQQKTQIKPSLKRLPFKEALHSVHQFVLVLQSFKSRYEQTENVTIPF